jgi:hypothetical protein
MPVRLAVVALLACLLAGTAGAETALIPREAIFAPPSRSRVQLSPDARHIAWLEPVSDGVGLRVRNLAEGVEIARGSSVTRLLWSADGAQLLYVEGGHLHALVPGADTSRDLTPFDTVTARNPVVARRRPGEILIELNQRDRRMFDVHRISLESGAVSLDTENPGGVIGWVADLDLGPVWWWRRRWARTPRGSSGWRRLPGRSAAWSSTTRARTWAGSWPTPRAARSRRSPSRS